MDMDVQMAVAVSYCSLERPFICALLRQACVFSSCVVVAVGMRLYSGGPEDEGHVAELSAEFPQVQFVRYPVEDVDLATPIVLHNRSRAVACAAIASRQVPCEWTMFLDGDEVPHGTRVRAWWAHDSREARADVAYKMANHWYFMHPHLCADALEDSVVLIHSSHLTESALTHPRERDGLLSVATSCTGLARVRRLVADAGKPMFHHYSWVRRRQDLIAKVTSWGHAGDRSDWRQLVERGLDEAEAGGVPHEFVHGYPLTRVVPGSQEMPLEVCPDMELLLLT